MPAPSLSKMPRLGPTSQIWVELLILLLITFYAVIDARRSIGPEGGGLLYPAFVVASLILRSRWGTVRAAVWAACCLAFTTAWNWAHWDDLALALRLYSFVGLFVITILSFQIRLHWARGRIGRSHSQNLIRYSPDAVINMDVTGRISEWNSQAESMFGYTRAEAVGRNLAQLIVPARMRQSHFASLRKFIETGETELLNRRVEMPALHRDQTEFPVELVLMAIGSGEDLFFSAIVRDVRAQRAMLAELGRANELFESVLNSTAEAICGIDRTGVCMFCNRACVEMLGFDSADELLGKRLPGLVSGPDHEVNSNTAASGPIKQAMESSERLHFDETVFWRQQGTSFFAEFWSSPLVRFGKNFGAVVTFRDITDKRRTAEYGRQLAAIVDSTSDAIIGKDMQGNVTNWNRGAEMMYGFTAHEMEGQPISKTLPLGMTKEEPEVLAAVTTGIGLNQFETVRRNKAGQRIDVSMSISPILDASGNLTGTSTIERNVTRFRADQTALRQAKEAAEEANRTRGEFLANVSHELRTPMNAILGMTELALEEDLSDDIRRFIQIAHESGKSLLAILNDILDFSKLESGKFSLAPEPVSIGDLLDEIAQSFSESAYEKGLELVVDANPFQLGKVMCDPLRLKQVIMNLLSNAIKFTDRGEVVATAAIIERHENLALLRVEVRDSGIGIAHKDLRRILDPFTQADASSTRRHSGTGLGLTICQELLHLMGSRLDLASEVGKGSRFWFELTLPVAPYGLPSCPQRPYLTDLHALVVDNNESSRHAICSRLIEWGILPDSADNFDQAAQLIALNASSSDRYQLGIFQGNLSNGDGIKLARLFQQSSDPGPPVIVTVAQSERQQFREANWKPGTVVLLNKPIVAREFHLYVSRLFDPAYRKRSPVDAVEPARNPSLPTRKLCVLVAEDTQANQVLISNFLRKRGHTVVLAIHGRDAVEKFDPHKHDLVLMDVQMPIMDGFLATAIIRKRLDALARRVPIIAMTAYAMRGDREKCLAAGMDDHLPKPISYDRLIETVEFFGNEFARDQQVENAAKAEQPSADTAQTNSDSQPHASIPQANS